MHFIIHLKDRMSRLIASNNNVSYLYAVNNA